MSARKYRAAVLVFALLLAAALASSVWRIPVQVADSLGEILDAQASPSVAASFSAALGSSAYLRPLRIAQIKGLFDLAQGRYRLAYRGFHAALVILLLLLFVRVLPVETAADAAAASFALLVLTGLHTFIGFVREAFPINHFLEIAVLCLAASNLSVARPGRWWIDGVAVVVLAAALLTLESGLLVWVALVGAWIAGFRGVSRRGLLLATGVIAGYFFLRMVWLDTGVPSLTERSAGFLLERLEPDELEARFGGAPYWFYAYNVVASIGSVLVAEPRDGVLAGIRAWRDGAVPPYVYLWTTSSLATTALIAWAMLARWRQSAFGSAERLAQVAAAVIAASAALSFAYTKDEIMAVGGVYYAFAAFAGARLLLERAGAARTAATLVLGTVLVGLLASAWAVRAAGVHHVLRTQVMRIRNDWAEVPMRLRRDGRWPADPRAVALIEQLRSEALTAPPVNRYAEWNNQWFGD